MVYWGCSTGRNRLAWAWVVGAAATGVALFTMGAAKLDACKYLSFVLQAVSIAECSLPPKAMLVAGAAMLVAALPPLLFFGGCSAPPPDTEAWAHQADITVVRKGLNGVTLQYKYDSAGRLVLAPDRFSEDSVERAAAKAAGGGGAGGWGRASPKLCETYVPRQWDAASCYVLAAPRRPPSAPALSQASLAVTAAAAVAPAGPVVTDQGVQAGGGPGQLSPLRAGRAASLARAESDLYSLSNS